MENSSASTQGVLLVIGLAERIAHCVGTGLAAQTEFAPGGCTGVVDEWIAMPEADDCGGSLRQSDNRFAGLRAVSVEGAEQEPRRSVRDDVTGEQHAVPWHPDRDTAVSVAGGGDDVSAAAEVDGVAVDHLRANGAGWQVRHRSGY